MNSILGEIVVEITKLLPGVYKRCVYNTCRRFRQAMVTYNVVPPKELSAVEYDTLIFNGDWNVLKWFLRRSNYMFGVKTWAPYFNDNQKKIPEVVTFIKLLRIIPTVSIHKLCKRIARGISKQFILFVKEVLGLYGRSSDVTSLSKFNIGENTATNFIMKSIHGTLMEYTDCDEHHMHPIMWSLKLSKVGLSYCTATEQILKFIVYRVNNIGLFIKYLTEVDIPKNTETFIKHAIVCLRHRCLPLLDYCLQVLRNSMMTFSPSITIGSIMNDVFGRPCDVEGSDTILEKAMELWENTYDTDFYDDLQELFMNCNLHFNRTILTEIFPNNRTPEDQMKAYFDFHGLNY